VHVPVAARTQKPPARRSGSPDDDARWFAWSADALARAADEAVLVINPIVHAEVGPLRPHRGAGGRAVAGPAPRRAALGGGLPGGEVLRPVSQARGSRARAASRLLHRCARSERCTG